MRPRRRRDDLLGRERASPREARVVSDDELILRVADLVYGGHVVSLDARHGLVRDDDAGRVHVVTEWGPGEYAFCTCDAGWRLRSSACPHRLAFFVAQPEAKGK